MSHSNLHAISATCSSSQRLTSNAEQIMAAAASVGRDGMAADLIRQGLSIQQAKCRLFDAITGYSPSTPGGAAIGVAADAAATTLLVDAMRSVQQQGRRGATTAARGSAASALTEAMKSVGSES